MAPRLAQPIEKALAIVVAVARKAQAGVFLRFHSYKGNAGDWGASVDFARATDNHADPLAAALDLVGPKPGLLTEDEIKEAVGHSAVPQVPQSPQE